MSKACLTVREVSLSEDDVIQEADRVNQTSESPGWSLFFLMKDVNANFMLHEVFGSLFCGLDMKTYRKYRFPLFFLSSCLEKSFSLKSMQINRQKCFFYIKNWLKKLHAFFFNKHYKLQS